MGDVIDLGKASTPAARKARRQAKARSRTLCGRGFHKWSVDGTTRFDVKQGRLVTVLRCERCDATREELR
jgi:hypothetical protein